MVSYFLLAAAFLSGCATRSNEPLSSEAQVSYYDRNADGKIDLEKHHYPGLADADWELRDDDSDGVYEKKVFFGFALKQSAIHIRVPTGLKIERAH